MKPLSAILAFLIAFLIPLAPTYAFEKPFPVDTGYGVSSYGFQLQVVDADGTIKQERNGDGTMQIVARPGERYAIRVYNPLPVRAAVNLTVDGVNTIDGKPCGIADGSRWMIQPMSWITIRGWQVNGHEDRRFFFTDVRKSYAAWRGARLHRNLSANCGVIGAAFFWNKGELARWQEIERANESYRMRADALSNRSFASGASCELAPAPAAKKQAGTGMGERETHVVESVEFNADAGMTNPSDALVVYYEFEEPSRPNPFPALTYSPEMP